MRMSCNGCRVLRKGCSEKCSIKPCLQWIKSPDAQANATVFLAKFYGRAGLLNLINAGPSHLRPAIFRSLLYEACGRIVSPINGSTGLLLAGKWQLCQEAVEDVLSGSPIKQESAESASPVYCPAPLKACDIRHVSKDENEAALVAGGPDLQRKKTRRNFKKAGVKPKSRVESPEVDDAARVMWSWSQKEDDLVGSPSTESALSQHVEVDPPSQGGESVGDADSGYEGTVEAVHDKRADYSDGELELELTLGFEPVLKRRRAEPVNADFGVGRSDGDLSTKSS